MSVTLQWIAVTICMLCSISIGAQTVILDFETSSTSTTFQYFGSTLDGTLSEQIDNPDMSGINTSSQVLRFVKPANSQVWAGAFSNPNPAQPVDLINNSRVCMKVWMPRPGGVSLKLEAAVNGSPDWFLTSTSSVGNEWVELCYDASLPSEEAPFTAATGDIYERIVIFTYFGTNSTEDEVVFIDEIIAIPSATESTIILDFETEETTTNFQYFGSNLDGQTASIIENPDKSGINTSDNVLEYVKGANAQVWAGAFTNPNPSRPIDLTSGGEICVKVWSSAVGNLAIKLEASDTGADWIQTRSIGVSNEWVELCYNASEPSLEGPFAPAAGHLYQRVVIFFDFGTPGGAEPQTYYLDDLIVNGAIGSTSEVTFTVNTSELGAISDDVFIIGTFNNWQMSTPMQNMGGGMYQATLPLSNGIYEYKYMVGDAVIEETFSGLEECTVISGDGEFINRRLVVSGDRVLDPACFNSCYNCGEGVLITINLGLGDIPADDSGVYVAGGQAFDAPGGRFRMMPTGNNVFSITFERGVGFSSFYTFTNGACPDYSCKEDISGQDCANPANFNDRLIQPVNADLTINTCFGRCTDNLDCGTTSVFSPSPSKDFKVFPTMARRELFVENIGAVYEKVNLNISSLDGVVVFAQQGVVLGDVHTVLLPEMASGTYFLTIQSGSKIAGYKFIKL